MDRNSGLVRRREIQGGRICGAVREKVGVERGWGRGIGRRGYERMVVVVVVVVSGTK